MFGVIVRRWVLCIFVLIRFLGFLCLVVRCMEVVMVWVFSLEYSMMLKVVVLWEFSV